jgi:hypothetical protein
MKKKMNIGSSKVNTSVEMNTTNMTTNTMIHTAAGAHWFCGVPVLFAAIVPIYTSTPRAFMRFLPKRGAIGHARMPVSPETSAQASILGFIDALYRANNISIAAMEPGLLDRMFHKHRLQSTSFGQGLVVLMQGRPLTFM